MITRFSSNGMHGNIAAGLAAELGSRLDTFNESWQLHSGLGMELLWTAFRPVSAINLRQLELSNQLKDLANRFDALRWVSSTSIRGLCTLQRSMVGIHNAIGSTSALNFRPIEVRQHFLLLSIINLLTSVQDVQNALAGLNDRSDIVQSGVSPYLESQFEMLCQYKACAEDLEFLESYAELSLFAGRSTMRFMRFNRSSNAWEALSRIQLATVMGHPNTELAAIRSILPISILHKLEAVNELPLRRLGLLRLEIGSISKILADSSATINGEHLQNFNRLLLQLREAFYKVSISETRVSHLERSKEALNQLLLRTSHDQRHLDERTQHLHRSLERVLDRQQPDIFIASGEYHEDIAQTSANCIMFFTGCLLLYVPDRPYDPALKPMVERKRHNKRKSELDNKLQALQDFELVFSGQKSSFRSQLVQKSLTELGVEPEVPIIFRPQISELGQLQAEFSNIVTSVIIRSPTPKTLQSIFQQESTVIQEAKLLRMNIAQAVSRLSNGFQAYEDITKPLVGFLQGLDVGLALSLLAGIQQNPRDQNMQYICEMTPFLGASPQGLAGVTVADLDSHRLPYSDLRLHFLKCIGMARSVTEDPGESLVQTMFQTFDSLYQEWKKQLERDQRHNAAESSLYRYRGGEEDSNEADEQDLQSLFPDYDRPHEQDINSEESKYDARDRSQRLAGLQREIFCSAKTSSERLLNLLQDASGDIGRLWNETLEMSKCPVLAENLVPALMLSLDQHKERLLDQNAVGKLYNFYSDANLPEALKLVAIVQETQVRFLDLQEAWPEHATLADVLRTSSELLALRHTEPIAKILTKVEQLHGYIHEWQVVASKQYTAATLYNQLTDLLVSWRRLELSTWARLLDMEDQKCEKDSDSWWFIAYEVIIAAPLSMIDAGEDLHPHVEQLFSTLAEFMGTTSVGQYAYRLGMISCFRSHLEMLAKHVPSIRVVHSVISNFLSYYARFTNSIKEHLRKGRQKLEKDMKDIVRFAGWKDTNINALRDSAKQSHHKLFKVIRKYRSLLAQSAETFTIQGFSGESDVSTQPKQKDDIPEMLNVDPRALETCKSNLEIWESKPERFTNPTLTAQRMFLMSQLPPAAIDGASYLDSFGTDLIDSIKILQKETPPKATKTNGEAVKHLKARKRKLYAETLKGLRQMGFRSNLSVDALSKQSSLSVILANTPAFATQSHPHLASAEFHFHQLLRMIPDIKKRSNNHSEDLSHSEVARSMGYLESIVSVILRQRTVLAVTFADLQELEKTTDTMYKSWAPGSYNLKKQNFGLQNAVKEVQCALRWLPGIIEVGSVIIEKHGRMGEIDHSNILADLRVWRDRITTANTKLSQFPELPSNLSSSRHEEIHHDAAELLEVFRTNLLKLTENSPDLAFVLKQIAKWANADIAPSNLQMDEHYATHLVDLDNSITKATSSILVIMQRIQEISSATPASDEDATWLIRADTSFAARLKNLRPREVNHLLREAISQIQYLSAVNDRDVSAAGAFLALALPIVQEFRSIVQNSFNRYADLHRALCKLSDHLARSFSQVVQEGFCSPDEGSAADAGSTEKLEGGTGLGEGEGAEDISKDIQDDEDLSELAQGMENNKEKEEIEDQEDAVNMDHDELEGETGDVSDKDEDDGSANEGEEKDIEEEIGDIDSLDPTAVDENIWDGKAGETEEEKEKEGPGDKGNVEKDGQMADNATKEPRNTEVQGEEGDDGDETSQNGVEEAEEVAREETQKIDPHTQEGQNLDLPEEMDLDNFEGTDVESASGDSEMEGMSDVEQESVEEKEAEGRSEGSQDDEFEKNAKIEADSENQPDDNAKEDESAEANGANDAGSPVDTEPEDDGPVDDPRLLQDRTKDQIVDEKDSAPSDAMGLGQDVDQTDAENIMPENTAQGNDGGQRNPITTDDPQVGAEDGQLGGMDRTEGGPTDDSSNENHNGQAFQKLGDALEKWHRQIRQIQEAPEKEASALPKIDEAMANREFEHLHDGESEADTQALGAASNDQARALDKEAMDPEMQDEARAFPPEQINEEGATEHGELMRAEDSMQTEADKQQELSRPGAFVASRDKHSQASDELGTRPLGKEDVEELDNGLSVTHLQEASETSPRSAEEARRLWIHYESLTRDLSLSLTEQLRLILGPTLATKMRGDFRTGKRLNIKRIIPYIASQYTRDKIWMRRSIPSKRDYQIMLAVDDSKSMRESGSARLAFETLALISKSLSMLEVGQICVVGFGNEVRVAHDFDQSFSSDAGVRIFQQFSFQQPKTNVGKLVADSISLFREARRKSLNPSTELWQLELIVSDGVCEDHDMIRRLVRQAQEEKIMIVFVIVDALLKAESILDMNQALFEPDATGEIKLQIKRYLDGFPFAYYLVVGDVKELPHVLAQALRQWFAEVVESG